MLNHLITFFTLIYFPKIRINLSTGIYMSDHKNLKSLILDQTFKSNCSLLSESINFPQP